MPDNLERLMIDRRSVLRAGLFTGLGLAAAPILAACGGSSGGPNGTIKWSAWANTPGETKRFKEFSQDLSDKLGTKIDFQPLLGDYRAKLLTQLSGGAAPDAFYVGENEMAKLIETKQVLDLTEYLDSGKAPVTLQDFHQDLFEWFKPADGGEGLFALPVDTNPSVFWFNKDLLADAGVTSDPAQQFEAGTWTFDALTDLLTKVRAGGKRGMVVQGGWWYSWFGLVTAFGGTLFDESGKAVFDTDPKAQEALAWMFEQLASGNITDAGTLPEGQGTDPLFFAGQLAATQSGRWILPSVKDLRFGYDIAPFPSPSGKDIMPVPVATAGLAVNAKTKNKDKTLEFLGNYVSPAGQKFRLSGGGNAVPSITGLDDIVTEDNLPPHAQWFNDIAAAGYVTPVALAANPKASTEFGPLADKLLKAGNAKSFSQKLVQLLNGNLR